MRYENTNSWSQQCLEHELQHVLTRREKRKLDPHGLVVAAVLCPIFLKHGEPHILLTKRTDLVEHHKGEVSFPGGKLDDTDPDLLHCALRETSEEVGIDPQDVNVIGELDDFYTVATNYLVVPFVGTIPYPYEFKPNDREIDEVLGVPMEIFFDPSRRRTEIWDVWGQKTKIVFYDWRDYTIWGATARILKHFIDLLGDSWIHKQVMCANPTTQEPPNV
jgi:8-oxo-dGTP pyrophosphatase MutT (NUDIX family)